MQICQFFYIPTFWALLQACVVPGYIFVIAYLVGINLSIIAHMHFCVCACSGEDKFGRLSVMQIASNNAGHSYTAIAVMWPSLPTYLSELSLDYLSGHRASVTF